MKNRKFDPFCNLQSLCEIGVTILNTSTTDTTQFVKKSMYLKNETIEETNKLFIPPIDREDIITLSLMLHKLNITISNLPTQYKEKQIFFSHIISLLTLIENELKNSLKSSPLAFLEKCDQIFLSFKNDSKTAKLDSVSELYERKNLLKQYFFGKINECFDQAFDITDFLVMAMVKNT